MATISIVVPAYNEAEDLQNLVDSVRREMTIDTEIVVVDNGSSDDTGNLAKRLGCRVVQTPHRMFPSAARNLGAKSCQSPIIVFLDADVVVTNVWALEVKRLAEDPSFMEGSTVMGESCHISTRPSWIERFWFEPLRKNGRSFVNGANMIISRKTFERSGGFNAQLETGEDVEFCERAMRLGIAVELNPDLVVHHEGFPKDLKSFFKREKWHGIGDFSSFTYFRRSKVAQIVALIGCCYLAILLLSVTALYGTWDNTVSLIGACLLLVLLLCAVSSLAKFWKAGPACFTVGAFIYFVYFNARLASMVGAWRSKELIKAAGESDESESSHETLAEDASAK